MALMKGFDPAELLATIKREKINFSLVPTMIYAARTIPTSTARTCRRSSFMAHHVADARLVELTGAINRFAALRPGPSRVRSRSAARATDELRQAGRLCSSRGFDAPPSRSRRRRPAGERRATRRNASVRAGRAVGEAYGRAGARRKHCTLFRLAAIRATSRAMDERGYMAILGPQEGHAVVSGAQHLSTTAVGDGAAVARDRWRWRQRWSGAPGSKWERPRQPWWWPGRCRKPGARSEPIRLRQ